MTRLDLPWRRAHLVGIGGAGMSAIARVLYQGGLRVSGSDTQESAALTSLRRLGIEIFVGHKPEHVSGADVVIVSAAIPDNNSEVAFARRENIEVRPRGQALAAIVAGHKVIGVSGTHGKTTTCGMIATVLEHAGVDPTYLLGADLPPRGKGGHLGDGDIVVVEADEAYGSFLWLTPAVGVVTNIDEDHLDHYGSRKALDDAFIRFMSASEELIVCAEDAPAMALAPEEKQVYGFSPEANVSGANLETTASGSGFDLSFDGTHLARVQLQVSGKHNVLNALAATAACRAVGIAPYQIEQGLAAFKGVSRRFEHRGTWRGADLFDDYAHHPAEIEATLSAASSGPWDRIIAVFQPHLYSRTQSLWSYFGKSLCLADVVVVTDIYGAREQPVPGVTGKLIVQAACDQAPGKRICYLPRLDDAAAFAANILRSGDLLLSLGAGDITTLHDRLMAHAQA